MKVFIDANILLDIYQLSGPDLEELRKLIKMVETDHAQLLISSQVEDEFWRNRERVIADAMKRFKESKATAHIPNIMRDYPETKELRGAVEKVNAVVRQLHDKATAEIENDSLKADQVIKELFSTFSIGQITPDMIERARLRADLGNPPGKKSSIGDAINWEWLLSQEMDFWGDELILISADGDFESELSRGRPREYLLREWSSKHPFSSLVLSKSLTDFLKSRFPDIQLAEEFEKIKLIEELEGSRSFATTHRILEKISEYEDFKESEVMRLIQAYLDNNQIHGILGDDDVRVFAERLVSLTQTEELYEMAMQLKRWLDELEDDRPF
jgi:arsenate reductase-like glutaredoxin family protein